MHFITVSTSSHHDQLPHWHENLIHTYTTLSDIIKRIFFLTKVLGSTSSFGFHTDTTLKHRKEMHQDHTVVLTSKTLGYSSFAEY